MTRAKLTFLRAVETDIFEMKIKFTVFVRIRYMFLVLPATKTQCQIDGVAKTHGRSGNIASITTNETGCGGTDYPWLVEVDILLTAFHN